MKFLILIFLLLVTPITQANEAWLYEVTRSNSTFYIYGSMHISVSEHNIELPNTLTEKIENAGKVYFEVDPKWAPEKRDIFVSSGDNGLLEALSGRELNILETELGKSGIQLEKVKGFQVWMLTLMLLNGVDKSDVLDDYLLKFAKSKNKEIGYLDNFADIIAKSKKIFDIKHLKSTLKNLAKPDFKTGEGAFLQAYLTGETSKFKELYLQKLENENSTEFREQLMFDRNFNWLDIIDTQVRSGDVLVFGAGHLFGEQGLIELLSQGGYSIQPIAKKLLSNSIKEGSNNTLSSIIEKGNELVASAKALLDNSSSSISKERVGTTESELGAIARTIREIIDFNPPTNRLSNHEYFLYSDIMSERVKLLREFINANQSPTTAWYVSFIENEIINNPNYAAKSILVSLFKNQHNSSYLAQIIDRKAQVLQTAIRYDDFKVGPHTYNILYNSLQTPEALQPKSSVLWMIRNTLSEHSGIRVNAASAFKNMIFFQSPYQTVSLSSNKILPSSNGQNESVTTFELTPFEKEFFNTFNSSEVIELLEKLLAEKHLSIQLANLIATVPGLFEADRIFSSYVIESITDVDQLKTKEAIDYGRFVNLVNFVMRSEGGKDRLLNALAENISAARSLSRGFTFHLYEPYAYALYGAMASDPRFVSLDLWQLLPFPSKDQANKQHLAGALLIASSWRLFLGELSERERKAVDYRYTKVLDAFNDQRFWDRQPTNFDFYKPMFTEFAKYMFYLSNTSISAVAPLDSQGAQTRVRVMLSRLLSLRSIGILPQQAQDYIDYTLVMGKDFLNLNSLESIANTHEITPEQISSKTYEEREVTGFYQDLLSEASAGVSASFLSSNKCSSSFAITAK